VHVELDQAAVVSRISFEDVVGQARELFVDPGSGIRRWARKEVECMYE
jgi:hypothetical protein